MSDDMIYWPYTETPDQMLEEKNTEIERLRLEADEDDAALAAAGYLHDKLSSLVRRFYRQCEDANVWFPMDNTLMRDAKRALGE
jgi:hypothetical protein